MNFDMIRWLSCTLEPSWRVLEYGSGGSTLFFARRVAHVESIEHHPSWYGSVRETLQRHGVASRCDARLVEPRQPAVGSVPRFESALEQYRGLEFDDYVAVVDQFSTASFNLVVVDGRCRVACARRSLTKLTPGGYLVLDNAQRERYGPLVRQLQGERAWWFCGCTPYQTIPATTAVWQIADPMRYDDRRETSE